MKVSSKALILTKVLGHKGMLLENDALDLKADILKLFALLVKLLL